MKSTALFLSVFDAQPFMSLSATAADASRVTIPLTTLMRSRIKANGNDIKPLGSLFHPYKKTIRHTHTKVLTIIKCLEDFLHV